MKKFATMILTTGLLLSLLAGCSTKADPKNEAKEKLVMGLDDTFAPLGFRDESGNIVGFDVDLAMAVGEKLDVEIVLQPIDWSMKETELNEGNIDMIWNGYSITDGRKEMVNFSQAYLENRQVVVVLSDSNIATKADLADKVIATQKESSGLDAIMQNVDFLVTIKNQAPVEYDTYTDCFMDLDAKRSEAIVVDEVLARYVILQRGAEKYKILDEDFGTEQYGIGIAKDNIDLLNRINTALDEMRQDGTYDEIYTKWFSK